MQPEEPTQSASPGAFTSQAGAMVPSGTPQPGAVVPTGTVPSGAVVPTGEAVFSTAHLVWLDLESGDELSIELFGPRPFLEELVAQGFRLQDTAPLTSQPDLTETQFRIHARVGRN
jgi:hypothetical protein